MEVPHLYMIHLWLSLTWKDWERKASNFPPEVTFQLYSFYWAGASLGNCRVSRLGGRGRGFEVEVEVKKSRSRF